MRKNKILVVDDEPHITQALKRQKQAAIIEELECTSPGITHLRTDDDGGMLIHDVEANLGELLQEMEQEMST